MGLGLVAGPRMATAAAEGKPAPEYIQLSGAAKAALHRPDPGLFPDANTVVIGIHRDGNWLSNATTKNLSDRGFFVIGVNPRSDNNEAKAAPWENNALDLAQAVRYARAMPGVEHVVLYGASGGGPTTTFYQAVAENGSAYCKDPQRLVKCEGSGFDNFPPVDGIITQDSHPGNTINSVRSISGGVRNDKKLLNRYDTDPMVDRKLDPFNPANGYAEDGNTHYSQAFIDAYSKAQSGRMNKLIDEAEKLLAKAEAKGDDDAPFVMPMMDNARLPQIDLGIDHSTVKPAKLLKDDGTIEDRYPVESVRVQSLEPGDESGFSSTMMLTAKSFLSVRAIRSTNSLDGIEWCTSNNSVMCALQSVHVPLLVTAMGGHYFVRDAEQFYDMAASQDKDFYVIEGATHGGTGCTACSAVTGQSYANAQKNMYNLMANWLNERFAKKPATPATHP
ncbi:alpha/beta hydrolase family protein [Nonomuraea jiangxiensis]|uniref:alpha/beta hydrolase family protein n=1 Tax=Nonomuraea jiangxiensis TaxID=633440 RepID=UPI00115FC2A6|nr:hypothetical protein [Nonomuraea jiangxiensis]